VFGAWGVVPIYLGEISPPAFRASFAGVTYQVSSLVFVSTNTFSWVT
jgi:SHS family lactate transporter-like MFS transporter